jgi:hypothetical protein
MSDLWDWTVYEVEAAGSPVAGTDVTGFEVESADGHRIGKVDAATYEAGGSFLVVDTGFWIFGTKRMLPAGLVTAVDPAAETVTVGVDRDAVKGAPDYDEVRRDEQGYRGDLDDYFAGSHYRGMEGDPIAPTPGTEHV